MGKESTPRVTVTIPPVSTPPGAAADGVESKRGKFLRLARRRVPAALKHIKYIRNLSVRGSYDYTPEHAERIVSALNAAVKDVAAAFSAGGSREEQFNL